MELSLFSLSPQNLEKDQLMKLQSQETSLQQNVLPVALKVLQVRSLSPLVLISKIFRKLLVAFWQLI
jgi:hypothetical protein